MSKFFAARILLVVFATILAAAKSDENAEQSQEDKQCAWGDENSVDGECIHPVWKTKSLAEVSEFLGCEWGTSNAYTKDDWSTFNRVYNEVLGPEKSSIPPTYESNGFQIPVEVKYSEDVGRGIFTTVPISEGDLVYISTNNAQFRREEEYLTFLRKLPKDYACDVLIWAFSRMVSAEKMEEGKDGYMACVDLDEGSFINSAKWHSPECNMELGTENGLLEEGDDERVTWYGCNLRFYANRDIAANEEIRADYGDFAEPHGWGEMGFGEL